MRKKIKFVLITLIGVSAFASLIIFNFNLYKKPETLESVKDISLFVDYNNGTIKTRTNFTLDNGKTTAFDALEKWCIIIYDDFGWGIIVRAIDGVSGSWIYRNPNLFVSSSILHKTF
ncbi:unnamed protein product [marine sediment metagenome]|uniref:Uncharacterized protein n=1 Tax=marine sediment metagenome TaxID=412755 RepID=X1THK5_9ZZZZ